MGAVAVESLESRRLMAQTVGQFIAEIAGNVAAIKATVSVSVKISTTDQHVLAADLHPLSKANAASLKTLAKDFKTALVDIHFELSGAVQIGLTDLNKAQAALQSAENHKLSTKTLALANKALAKLSSDDTIFVSSSVVNEFYATTAAPQTDEKQIGSNNATNATLTAALPTLEPRANFSTALYPELNTLVQNISTYATYILANIPGTKF